MNADFKSAVNVFEVNLNRGSKYLPIFSQNSSVVPFIAHQKGAQ